MSSVAIPTARRRLRLVFRALAYVLGDEDFDALAAEAAEAAEGDLRLAGSRMHALLVRGRPLRAGVPARFVADLAALEWATAATAGDVPAASLSADVVETLLEGDDWQAARLTTIPALRLVPVAFRLDSFVRRVERGQRPELPARRDCWILVARPREQVWRLSLPPAAGRLLSDLVLDAPLGEAVGRARLAGLPSVEEAHDHLRDWAWEGIFTRMRHVRPRFSPAATA